VSVEAREGACSRPWHRVSTQAVSVGLCGVAVKKMLRQWGHVRTGLAVYPRRSVEGRLGDAVRMRLKCDPCSQSARDQPACKVPRTAHRALHLRNTTACAA
jgi:hypothetical protein